MYARPNAGSHAYLPNQLGASLLRGTRKKRKERRERVERRRELTPEEIKKRPISAPEI
jgi:hypothetical protein